MPIAAFGIPLGKLIELSRIIVISKAFHRHICLSQEQKKTNENERNKKNPNPV